MDSPGIHLTDIMHIVNEAWDNLFALLSLKTAISDRGWGPLNSALLDDKDVKLTMTESENCEYHSMRKGNNGHVTLSHSKSSSKATHQSSYMLTASSMSELTDNEFNKS